MTRLGSQAGFTLLEVMTPVMIFSIGMLGVASMLTTSIQTDSYTADVRGAEHLAKAKVEELRAKSPTAAIAPIITEYTTPAETQQGDDPGQAGRYVRRWIIKPVECASCIVEMCNVDPACKYPVARTEVQVGWPRGTGCTNSDPVKCKHSLRLEGYIIQPPCPNCD